MVPAHYCAFFTDVVIVDPSTVHGVADHLSFAVVPAFHQSA